MDVTSPSFEILPLENVPIPEQIRFLFFFWKVLESHFVRRVGFSENCIIVNGSWNIGVVLRVLQRREVSVDVYSFDPKVSNTSRVRGSNKARSYSTAGSSKTSFENLYFDFCPVCELLDCNKIIFDPLVIQNVLEVSTIRKLYSRAILRNF